MTYRTDKFHVGDYVDWDTDMLDSLGLNEFVDRHADRSGPFIITQIIEEEEHSWDATSQTQRVRVNRRWSHNAWSGAYYRLGQPKEKMQQDFGF